MKKQTQKERIEQLENQLRVVNKIWGETSQRALFYAQQIDRLRDERDLARKRLTVYIRKYGVLLTED